MCKVDGGSCSHLVIRGEMRPCAKSKSARVCWRRVGKTMVMIEAKLEDERAASTFFQKGDKGGCLVGDSSLGPFFP